MFIYCKKLSKFLDLLKTNTLRILSNELKFKTSHLRFFDPVTKASYPIRIAIFDQKPMLGYFDPEFLELGFHAKLANYEDDTILNVI
jgi:hypothetical protein